MAVVELGEMMEVMEVGRLVGVWVAAGEGEGEI
jgi:hypothetical protein